MSKFIEKPSSKISTSLRGSVFGVGINDADYVTGKKVNGKFVRCPFYRRWINMLTRCYDKNYQAKRPTYKGCSVCDEWLLFSNFKSWMIKQNWEDNHLDKDLLIKGNKLYSPSTCLFVSSHINTLLSDNKKRRGAHPQGVTYHKIAKKFQAQCQRKGKVKCLGFFDSEKEAHEAYKTFKYKLIKDIAIEQTEPLKSALLNYEISNE